MNQLEPNKIQFWHIIAIGLSVAATWAFLDDIMRDWIAGLVTPAMVVAFGVALWKIKSGSFAHAALWFSAILLVAFVSVYDLLDLILDPIVRSDILIASAALVVVAGLWTSLSAVIAVEEG